VGSSEGDCLREVGGCEVGMVVNIDALLSSRDRETRVKEKGAVERVEEGSGIREGGG